MFKGSIHRFNPLTDAEFRAATAKWLGLWMPESSSVPRRVRMTMWKYTRVAWEGISSRVILFSTDALLIREMSQALLNMNPGIKDVTSRTNGKTASDRYFDSNYVVFDRGNGLGVAIWLIEQMGAQGWEPFAKGMESGGGVSVSFRYHVD
jgi:hypothetical protein